MPKSKKLRVAIVGLTCCEGCEFAILDLGKRFLDLAKRVDIKEFRKIKDDPTKTGPYDICFIEGSVVTEENLQKLKKLRAVSKRIIILGNCAHTGGVHRLKNWVGRYKALENVYNKYKGINNPPIYPITDIVKVDFIISGCPINGNEFLMIFSQILSGQKPQLKQNPVCYECQINGYECLLQQGEICCGPITIAGCNAVCLKSKQACWGCRGLLEEPDVEKFANFLLQHHSKKEVEAVLEIFGVKDDWHQQAEKEWQGRQKSKALTVVKNKLIVVKKQSNKLIVIKK